MMMRSTKLLCFVFLLILSSPLSQALENFQQSIHDVELSIKPRTTRTLPDWDQLLDQAGGKNVLFGVQILASTPYERNAAIQFAPASNTKLFTFAAAAHSLGLNTVFETRLEWKRLDSTKPQRVSEVVLYGSGDPTFGSSRFGETTTTRFDKIAKSLKALGVTEIVGDISLKAFDSRWDTVVYPAGWQPEDLTACYAALPQAFNLNENCATYTVKSATTGGWNDANIPVPVKLQLTAGSTTSLSVTVTSAAPNASTSFLIKGTFKKNGAAASVVLPVHDAKGWAKNLFAKSLAAQGIKITALTPEVANGPIEQIQIFSPKLSEIMKPFMKSSVNLIGDMLHRKMGELKNTSEPDLFLAGKDALDDYVYELGAATATAAGVNPVYGYFSNEVSLSDGSGISRANTVTVRSMMALLRDFLVNPDFASLWDSLPIAAVDGTLAGRMGGTAAAGVLRAKTGTLSGVYNMSGYVPRYSDPKKKIIAEYIPFVTLSKTTSANKAVARSAQDRVGAALSAWVNSPNP